MTTQKNVCFISCLVLLILLCVVIMGWISSYGKEPVNKTDRAIGIALNDSAVMASLTGSWKIKDINPDAGSTILRDGNYVTLRTTNVMIETESGIMNVYVDLDSKAVVNIYESPKRGPILVNSTKPQPADLPHSSALQSGPASPIVTTTATLVYSSVRTDSQGCPVILRQPSEKFSCPRDMLPRPSTVLIPDPRNITQSEADAIPVNFPGIERNVLVSTVLKDPCVIGFLQSGGEIESIIDQPRPTTGKETVRWPPTLMAYRRINCTEMFVFFDIDPSARNISRIHVEYR